MHYRYAFLGPEDQIEASLNFYFISDEFACEVGAELLFKSPYQVLEIWDGGKRVSRIAKEELALSPRKATREKSSAQSQSLTHFGLRL